VKVDVDRIEQEVQARSAVVGQLLENIERVVVGQRTMVERLLIGLLCNGHVLLEGVPGLAKTLTVTTLAKAIHARFSRIQFTPDLLPADLLGTLIYNPREGEFTVRKGPIFANLILADEVNRAPAKVQSALLEAMQERQVTIGDETHPLPSPFLVLATQNPIEQEGTYPLPEAQVDRFLLKLRVDYPSRDEERTILDRMASATGAHPDDAVASSPVHPDDIIEARRVVDSIYIDDRVKGYIVDVVRATRRPRDVGLELDHLIEYGASPRATIAIALASRAHAFLDGRGYVTPHDVKTIGPDALRHRVVPTYEAEAERIDSDEIVRRIFDGVPVP